MNIFLVSNDKAPTDAFLKLSPHLIDHGHKVSHAVFGGAGGGEWADIALIGMSTPEKNAEIEIAAARECIRLGKPFGFYADAHGAWTRPHFAEFREKASFVFVVADEPGTMKMWPNARIIKTGNPLWAQYFKPVDRKAAREAMSAFDQDFVILCPGTKNRTHNLLVWNAVIQAAKGIHTAQVVLSPHPGDKTDPMIYQDLAQLAAQDAVCVDIPRNKTDELVPGADVVINGTSVRVHAIARGIPVIDYYEPLSQTWLENDTGKSRSYFADSGAVLGLYGKQASWPALASLFDKVARDPKLLQKGQEGIVENVSQHEMLERMRIVLEQVAQSKAA